MNNLERLQLDKMIKENNVKDYTDDIRKKKHSLPLETDLNTLLKTSMQNKKIKLNNPDEFERILIEKCQFMFINYTDIFNRLRKDEIDVEIFRRFIIVLRGIENCIYDQHNGSYEVGKILKEIYIDSALRKANKLSDNEDAKILKTQKNISWKEYKKSI